MVVGFVSLETGEKIVGGAMLHIWGLDHLGAFRNLSEKPFGKSR